MPNPKHNLILLLLLCSCAGPALAPPLHDAPPPPPDLSSPLDQAPPSRRGFPAAWPWVSFYGASNGVNLRRVADTFRIINIDVDPGLGGFSDADIRVLKGDGSGRLLSYLNVGACEKFRSYYEQDPPGHRSCLSSGALTTSYAGYPDERWANLANAAYQDLIVNYVAVRLAARGVDGFFLDNLEVVEHAADSTNGPCDRACSQGGLELVAALRRRFPEHLIVMQNATSDVTRRGVAGGVAFPSLLDGVSHEEVYGEQGDAQARTEMLAWKGMDLRVNGRPFWLGTEDYVSACAAAHKARALALMDRARQDGFHPYVTDSSAGQQAPCFWGDL